VGDAAIVGKELLHMRIRIVALKELLEQVLVRAPLATLAKIVRIKRGCGTLQLK